jgi:hypothetical protein
MFTRRGAHPYGAVPIGTTDQHNLLITAVLGTRPRVAHAVSRQGRARRGGVQPHETRDVRARATPTTHLNGSWVAIQLDDCGLAASAPPYPASGGECQEVGEGSVQGSGILVRRPFVIMPGATSVFVRSPTTPPDIWSLAPRPPRSAISR